MKRLARIILFVVLSLFHQVAFAQDAEMADGMRASGKIYVVVGIILIVLIGLIVYLFMTDRKLSQMEEQLNRSGKPKSM